jgi:hypothetical protein
MGLFVLMFFKMPSMTLSPHAFSVVFRTAAASAFFCHCLPASADTAVPNAINGLQLSTIQDLRLSLDREPHTKVRSLDVTGGAVREWSIEIADRTISGTFSRWASAAGWQLVWDSPMDISVEAQARIAGRFEDAVEAVGRSLAASSMPIKLTFYKGNKVLRITRGDE